MLHITICSCDLSFRDMPVKTSQHQPSKKSQHGNRYRISMTREDYLATLTAPSGIEAINFNPPGDGNCQFAAVAYQLQNFGIYRSARTLRDEVVSFMVQNKSTYKDKFVCCTDWSTYMKDMRCDGTFGNHVTLHVMCVLFNVDILVLSSRGQEYTTLVSVDGLRYPERPLVVLGHLVSSEHYVSIDPHASCTTAALLFLIEYQPDEYQQSEQQDNDDHQSAAETEGDEPLEQDQSAAETERDEPLEQDNDDNHRSGGETAKNKLRKNPKKVNLCPSCDYYCFFLVKKLLTMAL